VSGIQDNLNKKPDLYAAAICIKVRSDHLAAGLPVGRLLVARLLVARLLVAKLLVATLLVAGLPLVCSFRRSAVPPGATHKARGMSPSPDLLLLFGGLFLRGLFRLLCFFGHVTLSKYKVGSINLCSRESACTAPRVHHNRKIDTVLLKVSADARSSVPGRRLAA
jgi:hypothetical protein